MQKSESKLKQIFRSKMLISKTIRTESGAARSGKGSEVHLDFAKHPNPRSARLSPADSFLLQLYRRRMTVKNVYVDAFV